MIFSDEIRLPGRQITIIPSVRNPGPSNLYNSLVFPAISINYKKRKQVGVLWQVTNQRFAFIQPTYDL